ncbi:uncharacterized protein LOC143432238 [Xylocopa sonorina]|uniref:uncharacterized protein LOC143432238 n=1 Tax=Xylocopa sonorina TaxID=1818115 RepID=UPI00403B05ED
MPSLENNTGLHSLLPRQPTSGQLPYVPSTERTRHPISILHQLKAAHLETVHDLTIETFIAENMNRKRICINLCSDSETNFVGANNEFLEIKELLCSEGNHKTVMSFLSNQSINWHFIPPYAQHFGLWEAAVKSYKRHLTRVAETELFTVEQFITLISHIGNISYFPMLPRVYTNTTLKTRNPFAFLVKNRSKRRGNTFGLVDVTNIYITSIYINKLTSCSKWTKGSHQITERKIVLLNEENTQSMQWPLGRIIQIYPGSDGIERAITDRTASSKFDLTVKKLVPLPDRRRRLPGI